MNDRLRTILDSYPQFVPRDSSRIHRLYSQGMIVHIFELHRQAQLARKNIDHINLHISEGFERRHDFFDALYAFLQNFAQISTTLFPQRRAGDFGKFRAALLKFALDIDFAVERFADRTARNRLAHLDEYVDTYIQERIDRSARFHRWEAGAQEQTQIIFPEDVRHANPLGLAIGFDTSQNAVVVLDETFVLDHLASPIEPLETRTRQILDCQMILTDLDKEILEYIQR